MAANPEEQLTDLPRGIRARVSGLIGGALGLVLLLVWLLSGGGTEWIRKKFELKTYLADGTGLDPGADVRLNGVRIGETKVVTLVPGTTDPNRVIYIDMLIETRFMKDIPVDSVAALTADNILGDKYVNIASGKATQTVEDGAEIPGLIENGAFNPADLFESLKTALVNADTLLTEVQTEETPLGQFVHGSGFYNDFHAQVAAIQKLITDYTDRNTPGGQLIFTDAMYNQIRQPLLDIDRTLEDIQRGENPAGQLVATTKDYDKVLAQLRSLHQSISDVNAGKGAAGEFVTSDAQYQNLRAQLKAIDDAVNELTKGDGAFAQMLQSDQLYNSLEGQSAGARDFLKDFREHPQKYLRIKIF